MSQKPENRDADTNAFEAVYAHLRGGNPRDVPWAHGAPHPMLQPWLDTKPVPASGKNRALVVGSGLGDDAEALAGLGWSVEAFDASETAIAWTRERFPESSVSYSVRDLFDLPQDWTRTSDLVVEVHTIQSLPPTHRQLAMRSIASTVAPDGHLVVVAMMRDVHVPLRGRPWPLTECELASFSRCGLREAERHTAATPTTDRPGRVRSHWRR